MKWQVETPRKKGKKLDLSQNALLTYAVLEVLPLTQDAIMAKLAENNSPLGLPQLCQSLLELELKGYTIRENGQYRKSSK
jgi:hypothetical protein